MSLRTRIILSTLAAAALAGAAASAVTASTAQASAQPPGRLSFTTQPAAIRFFSNTGPITGFPTAPLVAGDRIIGQDRILQHGVLAGHDNEACTVAFTRDVLCQDIVILNGQGVVQASWSFRWPATGTQGPASFDGIIDGGTGAFADARGTFHARALPDGDLQITATIGNGG